jgi:alkylated DNA repair protein alkB family protein 6
MALNFKQLLKEARNKPKPTPKQPQFKPNNANSAYNSQRHAEFRLYRTLQDTGCFDVEYGSNLMQTNARNAEDKSQFEVTNAPKKLLFIQDWVTEEDERKIIELIENSPSEAWRELRHRRLQMWGGFPENKEDMVSLPLPKWLQTVVLTCDSFFPEDLLPNHVLINQYLPGTGILPHKDGPLYVPNVAILSLGSSSVMEFSVPALERREDSDECEKVRVFLPRRSLIVFSEDLYTKMVHTITEEYEDEIDESLANLNEIRDKFPLRSHWARETRYSLTIRHVPNEKTDVSGE